MHNGMINLGWTCLLTVLQSDFTLCRRLLSNPVAGGFFTYTNEISGSHCVSLLVHLNAKGRYPMLDWRVCRTILKNCE